MKIVKRNPIIEYDNLDYIDDKILKIRGINIDKYDFLSPKESYLNDPFLLTNMDIGVNMVIDAISKGEKIVVYGDVDTDGVTSTQIIYGYIKIFTENVEYRFHQRDDGHGVIVDNVPNDTELLIIVDSSTNSTEQCKELSENEVKILILDHHEKSKDNSYATIINPQMDNYPNKGLSGAGIAWQFTRAFDIVNGIEFANDFVDLAGVGLVGDMMNMQNMENRYIVYACLESIKSRSGNLGLRMLFKELGKDFNPTSQDIAFYIAPCLNAIIRLSDIYIIPELFNCEDAEIAKLISKDIKSKNEDRKKLTEQICEDAYTKITNDKISIIDMSEFDYPKGLYGLIANKIAQETQKPCLVGRNVDGVFSGSGRTFGKEVELKNELKSSGLVTMAEGHQEAFGVKFDIGKKDDLINYCNKKFKDLFVEQEIEYDLKVEYDELTIGNLKLLDDINYITGEGFPQATLYIQSIVINEAKKIGKDENHTKITKIDEQNLDIMKFNTKESVDKYLDSDYINVVGVAGLNSFYNFGKKELVVTKQILSDLIVCETFDY